MKEYKIVIPDESYNLLNFTYENLPGVAVVNSALRNFKGKEVFNWQLTLTISLVELIENGMPSRKGQIVIDEFGDILEDNIKGDDKDRPNGLFLARITLNKMRKLIWRLNNPEIADKYLTKIINDNTCPRQFEYIIQSDDNWELTEWYLKEWNDYSIK